MRGDTSDARDPIRPGFQAGVPDEVIDAEPVGYSNITRIFDLDNNSQAPSLIFYKLEPWTNWINGWTLDSKDANTGIGMDNPVALATISSDAAYTVKSGTIATDYWQDVIWHIIKNIFESNVGGRPDISEWNLIQYFARVLRVHALLYTVLQINRLAYRTDWSTIYPYTRNVPPYLYTLAANLDADDAGLATNWVSLLQRCEANFAPVFMMLDQRRQLSPMLSVGGLHSRLYCPLSTLDVTASNAGETLRTLIIRYLDEIDLDLADVNSLVENFLPMPLAQQDIWGMMPYYQDPERWIGMWNTGAQRGTVFGAKAGKTGQQAVSLVTKGKALFSIGTDDVIFHSFRPRAMYGEVRHASIYTQDKAAATEQFMLTPHRLGERILFDDAGDTWTFDKDTVTDMTGSGTVSANWQRFQDFVNSRYKANAAGAVYTDGVIDPGMIKTTIPIDSLKQLSRQEMQRAWDYQGLLALWANTTGAALRNMRPLFRKLAGLGQ